MTKQYIITEDQIKEVIDHLECGFDDDSDAMTVLMLQSLTELTTAPVEYLLDGMGIKLNFNKMGNMTSLSDMAHDLQGRWVCFVGAENDKHLNPVYTHAQPLQPITAAMVTDEMIESINWREMKKPHAIIATAYNAVIKIKHRGDAT